MAVFPERIILKNSTDVSASITAAMQPTGSAACVPGEIVVQRLNGYVRLYALDSINVPRQITAGLLNENKGSLTVSNYGEGSSSFILNTGSVGTNELAASSVSDAKILGPISIAKGGTGQTTANAGLNALLPSQPGNSGKSLLSDGTNTSWGIVSYSINDLSDVETVTEAITGPSANQCLKWNSSAGQWKPSEDISTEPPIRPNSPCRIGQIAFDEEYLYCCVATDLWNRAPLSYWNTAEIYPKVIACSFDTYKPEEIGRPPDPYIGSVSLLLRANGADGGTVFSDSSPNNLSITRFPSSTAVTSTSVKKFGTASMYVNGNYNGGVTSPLNSLFNFEAGDFTVEGWMYVVAGYAGNLAIMAFNGVEYGQYLGWSVWLETISGGNYTVATVRLGTSAGSYLQYQSAVSLPLNTWHHIAVSRNGTNLRIFANGVQAGTTHNVGSLSVYSPTNGSLGIGGLGNQGAQSFNGYIDEFRITKGVGRYTSNFTVQTEQFNNFVI